MTLLFILAFIFVCWQFSNLLNLPTIVIADKMLNRARGTRNSEEETKKDLILRIVRSFLDLKKQELKKYFLVFFKICSMANPKRSNLKHGPL